VAGVLRGSRTDERLRKEGGGSPRGPRGVGVEGGKRKGVGAR
jgi:hypothetical protein